MTITTHHRKRQQKIIKSIFYEKNKKTSNDKRKKKSRASLFTPKVLSKVRDSRMLHSQHFRFKVVTLSLIDSIKLKTVKKRNDKILISQT